jgi:hypothetical protein
MQECVRRGAGGDLLKALATKRMGQYTPNLDDFNGIESAEIFNHTGRVLRDRAARGRARQHRFCLNELSLALSS